MAVTVLTATTQAASINYNYRTSGSTDWSSVPSTTYFYDLVDKLPHYKNSSGTVLEVFSEGSSTIGQTDIIYVDSTLGSDNNDSGRGNIDKPYATVEYVLSATTNTSVISGNTSNGSNLVSGLTNTSDIKVGQFITGNGIPYNTTILSITGSSVTISANATSTASNVALTWWTPKLLSLNGDFTATSNWFKEGFYFDSNPSVNVQWGNFVLYNITTTLSIPYINNSGFNYYGTTSTSNWFYNPNSQSSLLTFVMKFGNVYSNTTGRLIHFNGPGNYTTGNYIFEGQSLVAKFGNAFFQEWNSRNIIVRIPYTYALLGGVSDGFSGGNRLLWEGSIETPASIFAVSVSRASFINGTITGSVNYYGSGQNRELITSNIVNSTTCNIYNAVVYGNLPDSATLQGNVDLYGFSTSYLNISDGFNRVFRSPQWGITTNNAAIVELENSLSLYNLVLNNTSKVIINGNISSGGCTISSGTKLIVNGEFSSPTMSVTGDMENYGTTKLTTGSITINSGGKLRNYNRLESTVASTTVPLIVKNAGDLYLYPGSYLKVANSRGPLQCTANTSGSTNIYMFNCITNCDGSSYGLLIPFSAGTSYTANDLAGGLLYENTNY
jgi:hypothetical protein